MAARSRSDLIARVGITLGLTPAGTSLASTDSTLIGEIADEVWSEMKDRDIAPFPLTTIPLSLFDSLSEMVAARVAPKYGDNTRLAAFDAYQTKYMQAIADHFDRSPPVTYEFT